MENRSVQLENRELIEQAVPSSAELHALVEFFQLLARWEQELVQNGNGATEVNVCRVQ